MNPPRIVQTPGEDPRVRRNFGVLSRVLTSLLARGQITDLGNACLPRYSINQTLAANGGLTLNGAGELTIKLAPSANGVLTLGNDGLGVANVVQRIGNGTLQITGNVTLVGNGVGIVANSTFNNITLSANAATGGVSNIGNGTANATNNVTLVGNGITFVISGNNVLANVTGTGGGGGGNGLDPISSIYPPFAVSGDDDEFNDSSFTGFTTVDSGNHLPTIVEMNNVLSLALPGGDANFELHAYVKSRTIGDGNYVQAAFQGMGAAQNFNIFSVLMADGATYGVGNQVSFVYSPQEAKWGIHNFSGYNTQHPGGVAVDVQTAVPYGTMFMRLVKATANTYQGWVSSDGVQWTNVTGNVSVTVTPTHAGFAVTTWGGSLPFQWSVRYIRFG